MAASFAVALACAVAAVLLASISDGSGQAEGFASEAQRRRRPPRLAGDAVLKSRQGRERRQARCDGDGYAQPPARRRLPGRTASESGRTAAGEVGPGEIRRDSRRDVTRPRGRRRRRLRAVRMRPKRGDEGPSSCRRPRRGCRSRPTPAGGRTRPPTHPSTDTTRPTGPTGPAAPGGLTTDPASPSSDNEPRGEGHARRGPGPGRALHEWRCPGSVASPPHLTGAGSRSPFPPTRRPRSPLRAIDATGNRRPARPDHLVEESPPRYPRRPLRRRQPLPRRSATAATTRATTRSTLDYDPATNNFDSAARRRSRPMRPRTSPSSASTSRASTSPAVDASTARPATFSRVEQRSSSSTRPADIPDGESSRRSSSTAARRRRSPTPTTRRRAGSALRPEPSTAASSSTSRSGAQGWFPNNNHPSDKADLRLRDHRPAAYTALGNGELVSRTNNGDGTRPGTGARTTRPSSYLTTATVGLFNFTEAHDDETPTAGTLPDYRAIDPASPRREARDQHRARPDRRA